MTVHDAYRHCGEIARRHEENFPVASLVLPRRIRPAVSAIYAFARTADDYADEPGMPDAERLRQLDLWEARLVSCLRGEADHPVFIALADTVQRFNLPAEPLFHLLRAFRQDVTVHRYESFDDLLAYCRYSANPVGRLVLALFGITGEQEHARSDEICTALQLTNFLQDVTVDLDKDRVYIPLSDLRTFGVTEQELSGKRATPNVRRLLAAQVERTEALFRRGRPLLNAVHGRLRLELKLTWHGGMTILRKVRQQEYDVFRHRPVLTGADKVAMFWKMLFS